MSMSVPCPSDFALERFLLDELPKADSRVAEHLADCSICRAALAAKRADGAVFSRSAGAERVRRVLADRGKEAAPMQRRSAFAIVAMAAAIAVSYAMWHRDERSAATPTAPVAKADTAREEATVLRVQREWMEAIRDKDAAALDRILAEGYTYTDSRGKVSTKADSLRQARATGSRMTAFQTWEEKARVYGDTAVITGRLRVEGVARGEPYDAEVRFTDILARIDGEWRAVAAHASKP